MFSILAETSMAFPDLTSLSAAGMMGVMWLWERRTSSQREQQITDAHNRILSDQVQLEQLMNLVEKNTEALTKLCTTQEQVLKQMHP